jgi:hypothetical protein
MKVFLVLIGLVFMTLLQPINLIAQKDYSEKLKKDLVTIETGNFKATEYMYLKFSNEKTMQIQISAICPVSVMSRDNFISFYSTYGTILLLATFSASGLETPDIKELDELIGDPDITYNFVMAKNGVQIQVITAEGKENVTMKWDEMFAD